MTVETTPVPVVCHLQVSEELPVAAGLCRTDLRTDPSQPVGLLSLQRHRKYHGETGTQAVCHHGTPTPGIFTCLSVHRGAWSMLTMAVQRILIG